MRHNRGKMRRGQAFSFQRIKREHVGLCQRRQSTYRRRQQSKHMYVAHYVVLYCSSRTYRIAGKSLMGCRNEEGDQNMGRWTRWMSSEAHRVNTWESDNLLLPRVQNCRYCIRRVHTYVVLVCLPLSILNARPPYVDSCYIFYSIFKNYSLFLSSCDIRAVQPEYTGQINLSGYSKIL